MKIRLKPSMKRATWAYLVINLAVNLIGGILSANAQTWITTGKHGNNVSETQIDLDSITKANGTMKVNSRLVFTNNMHPPSPETYAANCIDKSLSHSYFSASKNKITELTHYLQPNGEWWLIGDVISGEQKLRDFWIKIDPGRTGEKNKSTIFKLLCK